MIFTLISLGTFTFGALAFSVLAATYWRERWRGHARPGGVFPVFTLFCALAFTLNLVWQSRGAAGWLLDVVTGLIPPLLFHLVYEQARVRARWLPALFYVATLAVWGLPADARENAPAILLGAAGVAGLILFAVGRRPIEASDARHRAWTRLLLILTVVSAAASVWQPAPWVNLLPDYLVLAFLAVTLYYRERLAFFDLLLKRGAFFAIGLTVLSLFFAFSTAPLWLDALLLAPLWMAAPWAYDRISHGIDRVWLHRPYGRVEAERHFVHAVQGADTEEMLREQATRALSEIFQTKATVRGAEPLAAGQSAAERQRKLRHPASRESATAEVPGEITLAPRPDGVPFLSDDVALRQSLERTLVVVLENVRFRQREHSLRLLAERAELKALRAQINPHFLFNALNAIAGLIHTRPALAEDTVERLAEIFRYTLRKSGTEWVRLDEEIEFVTACLGVEQARFGERLLTQLEIAPAAAGVHVPAMCVQPIVENAIKHGTSQIEGQGRIAIRAAVVEGRLSIQVTDNGPGFPEGFDLHGASLQNGGGHGLRNIAERLSGYYGEEARLRWENLPEGARVSVELPCVS